MCFSATGHSHAPVGDKGEDSNDCLSDCLPARPCILLDVMTALKIHHDTLRFQQPFDHYSDHSADLLHW